MNRYRKKRLHAEPLEDRKMLTVANFALPDVNESSATFNQSLGPTDFAGEVSGWYFGHST